MKRIHDPNLLKFYTCELFSFLFSFYETQSILYFDASKQPPTLFNPHPLIFFLPLPALLASERRYQHWLNVVFYFLSISIFP